MFMLTKNKLRTKWMAIFLKTLSLSIIIMGRSLQQLKTWRKKRRKAMTISIATNQLETLRAST